MPANPLRSAIRSGVRMNDRIGDLFGQIGTEAHPRGAVFSTYRSTRLALESALKQSNKIGAVQDVLRSTGQELRREVTSVFDDAIGLGMEESQRQLNYYGISARRSIALTAEVQTALEAVMSRFDVQEASIRALVLTDADDAQIIGDEDRTGVLASGEFIAAAAYWSTYLIWNAFDQLVQSNSGGSNFQKQAVAALDARTTDCCLQVHAQVQNMNDPFVLTGTPRFADTMDWPGFHWHCRTSGVLYQADYDLGFTEKMEQSAKFFIDERKAGRSPDRDPANAF